MGFPRSSGLVVMTAAKQECTAEGPGFESRLVHFYCSSQALWGLLDVPGAPQEQPQEPPGAPQEPPQEPPGAPQEAPEKRPEGAPEAP